MHLTLACGSLYGETQLRGAVAAFHALAAPDGLVLLVGWNAAEYLLIQAAAEQLEALGWTGFLAAFGETFPHSRDGLYGIIALVAPGVSDDLIRALFAAALSWLAGISASGDGGLDGGSAGGGSEGSGSAGGGPDDDEYSD